MFRVPIQDCHPSQGRTWDFAPEPVPDIVARAVESRSARKDQRWRPEPRRSRPQLHDLVRCKVLRFFQLTASPTSTSPLHAAPPARRVIGELLDPLLRSVQAEAAGPEAIVPVAAL